MIVSARDWLEDFELNLGSLAWQVIAYRRRVMAKKRSPLKADHRSRLDRQNERERIAETLWSSAFPLMTLIRKADEVERDNYLGLSMSLLIAKVEEFLGDVPYMDLGGMPFPPLWPVFRPYAKWLARRSNIRMMVWAARETRDYLAGLPQLAGPARPPRDDQPDDDRDTNTRVAELLARDPNMTSPAIFRKTGIPEKTIRRSRAWRERPKRQDQGAPKSTDALDHARVLSTQMLATIRSSTAAPAEIVADQEERERQERPHREDPEVIEPIEVLRRRYLEGADAGQRARFHHLNRTEQEHELRAWELTGDRLAE
jgi:hypothetical protein